jgi:ethanolamine ammonia-lyase large subunit
MRYNEGIDKVTEVIELGHKAGILKKWGKQITLYSENEAVFKYDIDEFKRMLIDNPEFYQEQYDKIKQFVNDLRAKK